MPAAAVMGVAAVGSAVAGGIASSKAAKTQKRAAMEAAARQQAATAENKGLTKDIYGQNTQLANNNYTQQLADNAQGYQDATGAVNTGYDQASQDVRQGYGDAINTMTPFASSNPLMAMYDMGGVARPGESTARPYDFQATDPSYKWRLQQGQQAVERSGAARGMTLSGSQLKGLTNYGQGAASQEYGAQFGRLSGMANQAQGAAGQIAGFQTGQGTALGNLATGRGNLLGGMATTQGNTLNSLGQSNLSNLTSLNNNYNTTMNNLTQTGTGNVNQSMQDAAQASASGQLAQGKMIQGVMGGLSSIYGGMTGPAAGASGPGMASPVSGGPMSTAPWVGGGNGYGTQSGYSPTGTLLRGSTGMMGGGV
jgi:hypothetical protein